MKYLACLLLSCVGLWAAPPVPVGNFAGKAPTAEAPAWTPASKTGMLLWLNPDEFSGTGDGTTVTNWLDSSGNDHHATNVDSTMTWATDVLSGGKGGVASLGSAGAWLASACPDDSKPFTLFMAIRMADVAGTYPILHGRAPSGAFELRTNPATTFNALRNNVVDFGACTVTVDNTTTWLLTFTYSGTGVWTFYSGTTASGTGTQDTTFASTFTEIGALSAGTATWVYFGDIIKWDSVISAGDLSSLVTWAKAKYGQ